MSLYLYKTFLLSASLLYFKIQGFYDVNEGDIEEKAKETLECFKAYDNIGSICKLYKIIPFEEFVW